MILFMLKVIKGFLSLFPSLQFDLPSVEPVAEVLNYFAWARAFLPIDVILILLGLTAAYYVFKLTFSLIKYIVQLVLSSIN